MGGAKRNSLEQNLAWISECNKSCPEDFSCNLNPYLWAIQQSPTGKKKKQPPAGSRVVRLVKILLICTVKEGQIRNRNVNVQTSNTAQVLGISSYCIHKLCSKSRISQCPRLSSLFCCTSETPHSRNTTAAEYMPLLAIPLPATLLKSTPEIRESCSKHAPWNTFILEEKDL